MAAATNCAEIDDEEPEQCWHGCRDLGWMYNECSNCCDRNDPWWRCYFKCACKCPATP